MRVGFSSSHGGDETSPINRLRLGCLPGMDLRSARMADCPSRYAKLSITLLRKNIFRGQIATNGRETDAQALFTLVRWSLFCGISRKMLKMTEIHIKFCSKKYIFFFLVLTLPKIRDRIVIT